LAALIGVFGGAAFLSLELLAVGNSFSKTAELAFLAHVPVFVVEAFVNSFVFLYLKKFEMKKFLLIIVLSLSVSSVAFAHKISAFVDVNGNSVSLISYFSDGTPAKNAEVVVYDSKGNVVLRGKTDKKGEFDFKIGKSGNYKVVVNAELGHRAVATFQIGKEEKGQESGTVSNVSEIRKAIREELQPIRRELLKLEEEESSISYKDVVGGLGWIVGMFGALMFGYCRGKGNGNAV